CMLRSGHRKSLHDHQMNYDISSDNHKGIIAQELLERLKFEKPLLTELNAFLNLFVVKMQCVVR
ncbi:hypothetical protein J3995_13220, partial [Lacticaseibacillus casei]|uniref:hypothetical protein n=1 Tax=Lacticaseibacillus casei TaxID=1582 RepID=UPI001FFDADFE